MEIDLRVRLEGERAAIGGDGLVRTPRQQQQRAARQRHLDGSRVGFGGAPQVRHADRQHLRQRAGAGAEGGERDRLHLVDQLAGEQPAVPAKGL
jgi:hypothetical protein